MLRLSLFSVLLLGGIARLFGADAAKEVDADVQLRAMRDELERAKTLQLSTLDKPYFIQFATSDTEQLTISASLGGILDSSYTRLRQPVLQVRVGDYQFDNTNSVYSSEPRFGLLPVDDDYLALRNSFWLGADALYKAAADQISSKRNALRGIAEPATTPDFSSAKPVQVLQPPTQLRMIQENMEGTVQRLSAIFAHYPNIMNSDVRLRGISSTYRLVNSEGTVLRIPQEISEIDVLSSTFAADGTRVWNYRMIAELQPLQLPSEEQMTAIVKSMAAETESLAKAPAGEDYTGPVLFEGEASSQMMGQVLTDAIRLQRKPLAAPNARTPSLSVVESVWTARVGTKVAPEWLSIYDDPHEERYRNAILAGQYKVDDEGVPAERVFLVEKGVLKSFLLSRMPVRNYLASNGHGRLPGRFGSEEAAIGNLFVLADGGLSAAQMKAKLIERVKSAGLPYGMIIRRLDFPSSASMQELQSLARQAQNSGFSRTLNAPILAFKVYPDGREELVRGMRFREFSAKDLRDIAAAGKDPYVFNYINNGSSLNRIDMGSDATTSSVVCPSLLFDSLELARAENQAERMPRVASPALTQ